MARRPTRWEVRWTLLVLALGLFVAISGPETIAAESEEADEFGASDVCDLIETNAEDRGLPPAFLARLIWQESRFNQYAVSPKGAQGIAQFMPATARERALEDPFDIPTALAESAAYLEELAATFGNIGLAAAGYNAGPARVRRWLAQQSGLPLETRHFVRVITGLSAEDWRDNEIEPPDLALDDDKPFSEACIGLVQAGLLASPAVPPFETAPVLPWGVQVAAHFSRDVAQATYRRLQREYPSVLGDREPSMVRHRAPARGNRPLFAVRIGTQTRQEAESVCADLRAAGGACMVMRN